MWYVLLTVILWGIPPVFDRYAAFNNDAAVGVLVRAIAVTIASAFVVTASGKWEMFSQTSQKSVACLAFSGIMAGCAGVFTYLKAMKEVGDAGKVAVLTSVYPLVALVITVIVLKEKLTGPKLFGSILTIAGIVFLNKEATSISEMIGTLITIAGLAILFGNC
ncbi:EamA family transporter [bacterium]|nr:EamA family transporter [bacterium]